MSEAENGSLAENLRALLESGTGADVTLVVGDSELPAHSLILAARSSVFAAMLQHDMREARSHRVEITDMEEAALKQLLLFVYGDTVPQLKSVAADLLAASDKYDLPLLKKMCEEQMDDDLTVDNAATTAVLAELHSCPDLKSASVDFIARHLKVMATAGWMNAMQNNVEAAAEICRQVAAAQVAVTSPSSSSSSSKIRILSESEKRKLARSLTKAAAEGQVEEVKELLATGASPNSRDSAGFYALHRAAMKGCVLTVQCLLAAGADVNARDSSQQSPLHEATFKGYTNIMLMLLALSADVNAKDRWGKTPLHWAVVSGNISTVKALRVGGANKLIKDAHGKTPLDLASTSIQDLFNTL